MNKEYLPTKMDGAYLPEQTSHIDGSVSNVSESNLYFTPHVYKATHFYRKVRC